MQQLITNNRLESTAPWSADLLTASPRIQDTTNKLNWPCYTSKQSSIVSSYYKTLLAELESNQIQNLIIMGSFKILLEPF